MILYANVSVVGACLFWDSLLKENFNYKVFHALSIKV